MAGISIGEALAEASRELSSLSKTPARDAQAVLAQALGKPREWLLAHPESAVPPDARTRLNTSLRRLASGELLPYVMGWAEFYGRRFLVTPEVLIPRPETELLVEAALKLLAHFPTCCTIVDLGTGSGCLGVTLALERPNAHLIATDRSRAALCVARRNAGALGAADRVSFVAADLAAGLRLEGRLVVANLPYVATRDVALLRGEPRLALDGGRDGTDVILRLLAQLCAGRSRPMGVLLEIGADQGTMITERARHLCRPARTWLR
jgi:release factor glutamine methyltransferase